MSKQRQEPRRPDQNGPSGRGTGSLRRWYEANRGDLRFLAIFGACLVAYYLISLTPPVSEGFFPAYLRLNAQASAWVLDTVGEGVLTDGNSLISSKGPSIQVERGCDAVVPSVLFVAAVMASPVSLTGRLTAALAGTALLILLNLVRIISLFWFRVYWPEAFETMHLDVWQALFIFLALALWATWASRAARERTPPVDAST